MARPRFKPSEEQRRMVKTMSALGVPQEQIAAAVEVCSEKTLRRHFREELDRGQTEANAQVAQTLFRMATSGQNPAASMFWLKCRAGWRDQPPMASRTPAPPFIVSPEGSGG